MKLNFKTILGGVFILFLLGLVGFSVFNSNSEQTVYQHTHIAPDKKHTPPSIKDPGYETDEQETQDSTCWEMFTMVDVDRVTEETAGPKVLYKDFSIFKKTIHVPGPHPSYAKVWPIYLDEGKELGPGVEWLGATWFQKCLNE